MKRQTTLAMYGTIFAAAMALGMITVSGFSQPLFVASTNTQVANHLGMLGHITLTATDHEGNILSYIQTDNIIVNRGENCVAESLFNVTSSGTDACDQSTGVHTGGNGVADGGFTYVAIGTGGSTPAGATNKTLITENNRTQDTTPSVTSSTGTGATSNSVVTLTTVFSSAGSATIDESGIFDDANAGNMLARKTFNGIPLNTGDKLTVEWEITIGGS